jgi:guanine deaminase
MAETLVLRGQTLSFVDDPFVAGPEAAVEHFVDGAVWMEDGLIRAVGPAKEILEAAAGVPVVHYADRLITAGFVDCHAHYPQLPIIASYGEHLLEWLEKYTFPSESRFHDAGHAAAAAGLFLDECLRNGITTSSVYATVHSCSVDAFFEAAQDRGLRMACGKVLMDRNAPEDLRDTAEDGYEQSKALIGKWHQAGRCVYAITPRFAPTSSPAQLEAAGELWKAYPDTLMQTHLAEDPKEIAWAADLFPEAPDYFGIYEHFGLTGPGAIFGHAIHLTERERTAISQSGSAIAHCPTSNTFIGSGLFDMQGLRDCPRPVIVGLATDVAGGSSMSMFDVMRSAYEVAQLRGYSLHPAKAWYLASVGSARAMRLDDRIGNLAPGMEADVIVIDLASTPLIAQRMAGAENLWDALFALMILADDRAIAATYAAGRLVHKVKPREQRSEKKIGV